MIRRLLRYRIGGRPLGVGLVFLVSALSLIARLPRADSLHLFFGFQVSQNVVAIEWLIATKILPILLFFAISFRWNRLALPLGMAIFGWRALDGLITCLVMLTNDSAYEQASELVARTLSASQIWATRRGVFAFICIMPAIFNLPLLYALWVNKDYFEGTPPPALEVTDTGRSSIIRNALIKVALLWCAFIATNLIMHISFTASLRSPPILIFLGMVTVLPLSSAYYISRNPERARGLNRPAIILSMSAILTAIFCWLLRQHQT